MNNGQFDVTELSFYSVGHILFISMNLLAFYHKCHSLIGYTTHIYSVIDTE